MSAITSPEFISLCRAQLRLLTQQLSESSAALYIVDIAEQVSERGPSNYVPVVSYPEPVDSWVDNFARATNWASASSADPRSLPGTAEPTTQTTAAAAGSVVDGTDSSTELSDAVVSQDAEDTQYEGTHYKRDRASSRKTPDSAAEAGERSKQVFSETPSFGWPKILHPEQQLVVPLVYTDVVVGLLISVRRDRAWKSEEQRHIEAVAQSLAAGCVLERRNQWLQTQLAHKRGLQSRQSEVFHNLLHQFRNPLTAVSTFGQLLVKRLDPADTNQPIATGIVRESKRLRELVTHFDQAVAIGDTDLAADNLSAPVLPGDRSPVRPANQALLAPSQLAPSQLDPSQPVARPEDSGHIIETDSGPVSESTAPSAARYMTHAESPAASPIDGLAAGLGQPLTLSAQYLPDIVEPILAVSGIVAAEKGIDLQCQVASDTPMIWGEEEALGEVVSNLVDNAVKYSPPGALVWVQTGVSRVSEVGHYQGVVIGDTGPGIPVSDRTRLFERNYRGIQAQSDIPGTGLGLAIAQSLVHEMQGSIEVVSPAAGTPWMPPPTRDHHTKSHHKGTVFIVWLLEVDRAHTLGTTRSIST